MRISAHGSTDYAAARAIARASDQTAAGGPCAASPLNGLPRIRRAVSLVWTPASPTLRRSSSWCVCAHHRIDLRLFDFFDHDLNFFVFFISADERVYGRYGGRDGKSAEGRHVDAWPATMP